ncbi:MAG: hypothetical protein EGQ81_04155 [Akkermansia sp.]|jgi:hypothetical protein|nr:hypothetical protein [Akkermansia sp.]
MAVPGTAKYSRAWPAGFDEGTEYLASYKILPEFFGLVQSGEISDRSLYLPKGNGRTLLIRCVTMERLFWTNNTDLYSTIN